MSRLFGPIRQLGIVVKDFDVGVRFWTDTIGVGPFFVRHKVVLDDYWFRGRPAESPELSIGQSFSGPLNVEIIAQTNTVPSPYSEFFAQGKEGFHHNAYWFETAAAYDEAYAHALAVGLKPVMEGRARPPNGRFVYFERNASDPAMVELVETSPHTPVRLMQREAAASWDGSDPVRS